MFSGILMKTLKGKNIWSRNQVFKIDIVNVSDFGYHKRLFRIFDFREPHSIYIDYYEPRIIFPGYKISTIERRFSTEEEALSEIKEIKNLMKDKESLEEIFRVEMLQKLDRYKFPCGQRCNCRKK